jgi:MtN3 and saliva related transmembrane protein
MDLLTDTIGYIAAFLGAILLLPQVWKSYRSRSARDISLIMVIAYLIATLLWLIYGYLIQSYPVIVCNAVAFCFGIVQLVLKLKYSQQ